MTGPPATLAARMFFIVGRGRSGTTLLARLLDRHPEVAVAPESLFIMYLRKRYSRADWSDRETVRRFARDLWYEERMRRWKVDPAAVEARLLELDDLDFATACAAVYRARAAARGRSDTSLLGDKNPHYALFVDELAESFPEARFIHLTRHPPANIVSYLRVRFDLSSIPALAERWRLYHERILEAERRLPDRFFRLSYEDLVSKPRACLEATCRFLGIDFDPAMLAPPAASDEPVPEWHSHLTRPPDPERTEAWRDGLDRHQLEMAEGICQPLGTRLGYSPLVEPSASSRLRALPGITLGRFVTALERLVFLLPLRLRASMIRCYRVATGNRIR